MREREAQQQKQKDREQNGFSALKGNSENVYEYLNSGRSSSPDSDSSREKHSPTNKLCKLNKRSESSIDVSGEYFKYSNIPRSVSLTYCGSETESEIYSPYGFYGSESEVSEIIPYFYFSVHFPQKLWRNNLVSSIVYFWSKNSYTGIQVNLVLQYSKKGVTSHFDL